MSTPPAFMPPATPRPATVHAAGAALCAALTLAGGFAAFGPLWAHRAQAREQAAAGLSARDRADSARAQLDSLRKRAAELTLQLASNRVMLRPVSALNEHLGALATLAAQRSITLDQIAPGKVQTGPKFSTVPLHVTGSGTYPAVASLLEQLHTTEPTTAVVAFTIHASQSPETTGPRGQRTADASFTLDLLWHALPHATDPAASADRARGNGSAATTATRPPQIP
ncbi:MAG: GspMb/PilO family protein [Phycisphaerales bacterium]